MGLLVPYKELHLAAGEDAEYLAGLVAADVQVACNVEGEPVRKHPGQGGYLLAPASGAVGLYGDAKYGVAERLGDVEVVTVGRKDEPVGEVYRFPVPELATAVGPKAEDPRPRLLEGVAVGDAECSR